MTVARSLDDLRVAAMMLTRLPVGDVRDPEATPARARWAFPVVGIATGAIAWIAYASALWIGLEPLLAAAVAVTAAVLVTGALHHDGLADYADGAGGGQDRARRLEIMRDSRIGSYGVLALVLVTVLQIGAIVQVNEAATALAFVFVAVASRFAMLCVMVLLPNARTEGLGASVASGTAADLWPGAVLTGTAMLLLGWAGMFAVLAVIVVTVLASMHARRTLGGQTGDVLGAVQIMAESAAWLAIAAAA